MAAASPVFPTAAERKRLKTMAFGLRTEYRLRVRAQVVLHAARGRSNARIARETGLHMDTVRTWRGRFADGGLPALADRRRCGRPARFTPVQVAKARAPAYLAAYDVHRARVFGRCETTTGIVPFMNLVTQVLSQVPCASAKRVFWIVDNGSSHRGKKAIDRLTAAFPNAVMVHTPVHASWTNQVEIFFSVVQRKVVVPNDFTNLDQVRDRLRAFEDRYNATARPFQWKFTTSDLDYLLARLDRHTADHPEESSAAPAA
ncbi:helix-turn-helix domain-containing protein [Streptomyces sp. NPDC097727]|uniref:helix-turn-helix domain-containing protein n=1 Tax=Streptomyces sp. NPDC097727 TaxID=3366092 RepID=UPI0037F699A3